MPAPGRAADAVPFRNVLSRTEWESISRPDNGRGEGVVDRSHQHIEAFGFGMSQQ